MPKKKTVNYEKLLKAVETGLTSKEIMEKFGIKTSAQLKGLYLDALVSKGKAVGIPGRGGGGVVEKSKAITVNKRGSLVIAKDLVAEMGFAIDDVFTVRKTKSGVSLRKI